MPVWRLVLLTVRVNCVRLYVLKVNGKLICEVTMNVPSWMPSIPRLDPAWLRGIVAEAIRNHFQTDQKSERMPLVKV